tara:strand:- start:3218 stop:3412 length:195 start_codon:yes stop_codon:yes gene_type:complete
MDRVTAPMPAQQVIPMESHVTAPDPAAVHVLADLKRANPHGHYLKAKNYFGCTSYFVDVFKIAM